MKRIMLLMLTIAITTVFGGCGKPDEDSLSNSSERSSQQSIDKSTTSAKQSSQQSSEPSVDSSEQTTEKPTQEELKAAEKTWDDYRQNIFSDEGISMLKFAVQDPMRRVEFEITDAEVIEKWGDWLNKIEVSSFSIEYFSGSVNWNVAVQINGVEKIYLNFQGKYINIHGNNKIMYKIDNYSEIQSELGELQKLCGMPEYN